jgi:hypothetical protein
VVEFDVEDAEELERVMEATICGIFSKRVARQLAVFTATLIGELQKRGFTREEAMRFWSDFGGILSKTVTKGEERG